MSWPVSFQQLRESFFFLFAHTRKCIIPLDAAVNAFKCFPLAVAELQPETEK